MPHVKGISSASSRPAPASPTRSRPRSGLPHRLEPRGRRGQAHKQALTAGPGRRAAASAASAHRPLAALPRTGNLREIETAQEITYRPVVNNVESEEERVPPAHGPTAARVFPPPRPGQEEPRHGRPTTSRPRGPIDSCSLHGSGITKGATSGTGRPHEHEALGEQFAFLSHVWQTRGPTPGPSGSTTGQAATVDTSLRSHPRYSSTRGYWGYYPPEGQQLDGLRVQSIVAVVL